ncbi:hypothetical protein [Rhodococcus sp. NPDC058514]|uniref:hypothetical protein n=1 Tax=unclassified Rhodococcus (in: high G+C Gram-positive bacteria) TaxID=192944 RepID=UPI00364874B4
MTPAVTDFRALARSSPWRWSTLEFELDRSGMVEHAWIARPDRLRVESRGEVTQVQSEAQPFNRMGYSSNGRGTPIERVWPTDVDPTFDGSGLVSARPEDVAIDYDPPLHSDYFWVALLDPVELSDGVEIGGVREVTHHGRQAWEARVRPTPDYEPRCDCCALLSGSGALDQVPWVPNADTVVRLDVQTGVCVSIRHLGDAWCGQEGEIRILAVDEPMADELFRRRRFGRWRRFLRSRNGTGV